MPSILPASGFVAMCLLENVKDGHALHSARATVDGELASGGDISSVPGCSVRMAGGILDVDGGFLSALGYRVAAASVTSLLVLEADPFRANLGCAPSRNRG